uniref:Adenosine kinase n=1 Tax=Glossina morsitans morsitans TaxID=37546 RepID=A0A1B0G1U0_GLOMM
MERLREHFVVSLGNPLLDMIATVDREFLEKYNLRPDNAILAKDEHMNLYKELDEKYNPDYIAGGSAQNTLRICQWLLQKPKIVTFFGCVGKDDYADILHEKATQDGLNVFYQYAVDAPTGTCAVLISNGNRSLCARLAAANEFKIEHLQKPENRELWESARYFYITGFFLVTNPPAVMQVARHAHDSKSTFMMNLSATFVMQQFKEPLMAVMPYVKVLFGNGEEAKTFARVYNWETKDLKVIGLKLVALDKENCEGERIVFITQGPLPVLAFQGCTIKEYPVPKFNPEQIVDTSAAGDAFCGGFLAQYIQNRDFDLCVHCGIWAASQIIQQHGCTFEGKPSFRE